MLRRKKVAEIPRTVVGLLLLTGSLWLFTSVSKAQVAYGKRIVAPERPDTPQNPDMLLKPAIADLQDALHRMTGQEYSVSRGDQEFTGPGIFLVRTNSPAAPADAVTKLKNSGREPFIIRSKDAVNLWIISNGEEGLSHGIYFYLEQLSCHWFLPNEHWTVIPKRDDVTLKVDRLVAPAFKSRGFFGTGGFGPAFAIDPKYDPQGRLQFRIRTEDWKRRNRFGGEFVLAGHAGESFNLAHKEELVAHPEYLAEVGGKREWGITAKLDASNPAAVKLWVDDRLKDYRQARKTSPDSPYSFAVSVDPADGGGFCECNQCRKMFAGKGENDQTFYSNQVFYMANEVAKAVRKEFPDGYVSLYGYADHSAPPSFDLEPNVYVMIIPYGFNYSGLQPNEFISAWGKKTSRISIYDYWSIPDWSWDLPTFNYLEVPKDKIRYWHANNVEGFASESTYGAGAMGIGWYLSSRMMWNPDVNQDAILNAFYTKSFGPAAPPMKRMLERWATNFLTSAAELGASYADIKEAQTLAGNDTTIQARIDDFAKYVHYLRLYYEYFNEKDPKERLEANRRLIEHLFDIYDTNMVHSFRLYQFLVDYGRTLEVFNEFHNEKADAPGWKKIAPLSHAEVAQLMADGAQKYPPVKLDLRTYSGKLVPLQPVKALPAATEPITWGTRMPTRSGMDVEIETPPGLKVLPINICKYYTNDVKLVDAAGKTVAEFHLEGTKDYQNGEVWNAPIPKPGRYTIEFRPIVGGGFWFQTLPDLTLTMKTFMSEMGAPSPRLYFYVPRGHKQVVMWYPTGEINQAGPPAFYNADGKKVKETQMDSGKMLILEVEPGQDGRVWSLEGNRSPNYPHKMLNTPQAFSLSPDTLMVPEDALK